MVRKLGTTSVLVAVTALAAACGGSSNGAANDNPLVGSTPSSQVSSSASVPGGADCGPKPTKPAQAEHYQAEPKVTVAPTTYTATVVTNCGTIVASLDAAKAPHTVNSFAFLAGKHYFDNSPCHRLTTQGIFVLQCGDPLGGTGSGPGYSYGIENAPKDGTYPKGTLAMARTSDPNSNADQFFLVYKDTKLPTEGGGYSIFGTVTGGMDIVEKIAAAGVSGGATDGAPAAPISILKVAVTEKKA